MTSAPLTEAELLDGLAGTYTLAELYTAVEAADLTTRADGVAVVHGRSDTRWHRRVRGALQHLKRQGRARRAGDSVWVLDGHPHAPRRAVLVCLCGPHRKVELRLQRAGDLLGDLDGPADLILTDPPYGLGVGGGPASDVGARTYRRDEAKVVVGYVDVAPDSYREFTGQRPAGPPRRPCWPGCGSPAGTSTPAPWPSPPTACPTPCSDPSNRPCSTDPPQEGTTMPKRTAHKELLASTHGDRTRLDIQPALR